MFKSPSTTHGIVRWETYASETSLIRQSGGVGLGPLYSDLDPRNATVHLHFLLKAPISKLCVFSIRVMEGVFRLIINSMNSLLTHRSPHQLVR